MDHEKLLAKYIQYIIAQEGTDYLGYVCTPSPFTEAEWNELCRLALTPVVEATDDA